MKTKGFTLKILLALIFPLYALPWVFKGMIRNEKWAYFLYAFFMGLIGILYPPVGDFNQYTMKMLVYNSLPWDKFIGLLTVNMDFLLYLVGYILDKIHIPFDLTRFLYNFFGYYVLCMLYRDLRRDNSILNNKKVVIKTLIVFVGFSMVTFLFRFGFSSQLFVYGAYLITYKHLNKKGWILITIAILNHFSFILFGLFLFLFKVFHIYISKTFIAILGISAVVFSGDMFMNVFQQLPLSSDLVEHYSYYLDGYYAQEWQESLTWKEKLAGTITTCIAYVYIFIFIYLYSNKSKEDAVTVNILMFLSFITLPFTVINERFLGVMVLAIKVFFLKNFKDTKILNNILGWLLILSIVSQIMGIWNCRRQLSISRESQLIYMPSFMILTNTYEMEWIRYNVDSEGGLIQVKY